MAYNKDLDKVIWSKNIEGEDDKALVISVYSYNGGEPKMQIGPRTYIKRNGEPGFSKAGRLTIAESIALIDIIPEALDAINKRDLQLNQG